MVRDLESMIHFDPVGKEKIDSKGHIKCGSQFEGILYMKQDSDFSIGGHDITRENIKKMQIK